MPDKASFAFAITPFPPAFRLDVLRPDVDRFAVPAFMADGFFFAADGLEAGVFFAGVFFLGGVAFFVVPFFAGADFLLAGFRFVVGILLAPSKDKALAKNEIKYQRLLLAASTMRGDT
jgi:hypothetical protein